MVRKFYPDHLCQKLATYFTQHPDIIDYTHDISDKKGSVIKYLDYGVQCVGLPLNTVYNDPGGKKLKAYVEYRDKFKVNLKKQLGDSEAPIDKFRSQAKRIYERKVSLASINGEEAFCGITRITTSEESKKVTKPHIDAVPEYVKVKKQFAANVYLQVPSEGGELRVWDSASYEKNPGSFDSTTFEKDPQYLSYKPSVGDMVIFNTRRPHAVGSFPDETRVNMQCFFGLTEEDNIVLWN